MSSDEQIKDKSAGLKIIEVDPNHHGQRVDNFLMAKVKGVPKSLFYRLLRKGAIRVNKKRTKPDYRLQTGDVIRMPNLREADRSKPVKPSDSLVQLLQNNVLYNSDELLIINKPAGIAVHAGSGFDVGVIEALRAAFPDEPFLQLAHRLDRDTSGCLLLAKNRESLNQLQDLHQTNGIEKVYLALTKGCWRENEYHVDIPLRKNKLDSGERVVKSLDEGKMAITDFKPVDVFDEASLVEARLRTGRTHQIRVHAQCQDHPLAGDLKYGDREFNKAMRAKGLKRLFLHAARLRFKWHGELMSIEAPLDEDLELVLKSLTLSSLRGM